MRETSFHSVSPIETTRGFIYSSKKLSKELGVTELGTFLKHLMLERNNMSQKKLSEDLGYSESQFSNIMNGKANFSMKYLIKCREYFNLNKEKTIELFRCAFSSFDKIVIEPEYLNKERKSMLISVMVSLLLYRDYKTYDGKFNAIKDSVKRIEESLKSDDSIDIPGENK
jgi:transcriptional regulator with XRE-family HTH domain